MALYDTNKNLIAGSRKTNIYRCNSFAEYEALPAAEKAKYDYVATPDAPTINTATPTEQLVSGTVRYMKSGNVCTIVFTGLEVNTSESNRLLCTGLPLPIAAVFFVCDSGGNYYTMNINTDGSLRDANNIVLGNKGGLYGSATYVCQ